MLYRQAKEGLFNEGYKIITLTFLLGIIYKFQILSAVDK